VLIGLILDFKKLSIAHQIANGTAGEQIAGFSDEATARWGKHFIQSGRVSHRVGSESWRAVESGTV